MEENVLVPAAWLETGGPGGLAPEPETGARRTPEHGAQGIGS